MSADPMVALSLVFVDEYHRCRDITESLRAVIAMHEAFCAKRDRRERKADIDKAALLRARQIAARAGLDYRRHILADVRVQSVVRVRDEIIRALSEMGLSSPRIAAVVERDHTTVLASLKRTACEATAESRAA